MISVAILVGIGGLMLGLTVPASDAFTIFPAMVMISIGGGFLLIITKKVFYIQSVDKTK